MQKCNEPKVTEEAIALFEQWLARRVDPKVKPIISKNINSINDANILMQKVFSTLGYSTTDAIATISRTWFDNCGLAGVFNYYYSYCQKYYGIDVRTSPDYIVKVIYGIPFGAENDELLDLYDTFLFNKKQFPDTQLKLNNATEQACILFDYYLKKHPEDAWENSESLYNFFADERGRKYIKNARLQDVCYCVFNDDPLLFLHYALAETADGLGKNEASFEKAKLYRQSVNNK